MKVILLQDVAKIGRRYEEVNVPDGYALNMLIPRGMAQTATPENKKKIASQKGKQAASLSASEANLDEVAEVLANNPLLVETEANDQDHLFQALKAESIVEAAAKVGAVFGVDQVIISEPIKSLGDHTINLKAGNKSVKVKITVVKA